MPLRTIERGMHAVYSAAASLTMALPPERETWPTTPAEVRAVEALCPAFTRVTLHAEMFRTLELTGPDEYFGLLMPGADGRLHLPDPERTNVRTAIADDARLPAGRNAGQEDRDRMNAFLTMPPARAAEIVDDDFRAFGGKRQSIGAAKPPSGSGDDDDASLANSHDHSVSSLSRTARASPDTRRLSGSGSASGSHSAKSVSDWRASR